MRAVWYDRQGAADEVLVCGELPTPDAGYGEVRVKLEASGVNPSDTYRRRGPPAMEYPGWDLVEFDFYHRRLDRPLRRGWLVRTGMAVLVACCSAL